MPQELKHSGRVNIDWEAFSKEIARGSGAKAIEEEIVAP
jgi:hypothetical protein